MSFSSFSEACSLPLGPFCDILLPVRLDRVVGKWGNWGRRRACEVIDSGAVTCDGVVVRERAFQVGKFVAVCCHGEIVQARVPRYLMLHKPLGVVSATVDAEHATVVDLIAESWAPELHLAGRLDRFTSGLLVLTNDSSFSESITAPELLVGKRYLVEVDQVIEDQVVTDFRRGLWFAKEQVWTSPAQVSLLAPRRCRLTIYEGKHHQVKRMFARYQVRVTALHREAIGALELDAALAPGEWRSLTEEERGAFLP